MQHRRYITNRRRARAFNVVGFVAVGTAALGAIHMALFTQMAIHVAQGNRLHIGADILFQNFSVRDLLLAACGAGAVTMLAVVVAAIVAITAEG